MQLKSLYKSGLAAAEQEERVLRAALARIYEIRAIRNERRIQVTHLILDYVDAACACNTNS